eukprot:234082_1
MYQRLIMCVDDSGSMSGTKIESSIQYLNDIAREFGCETHYYKFGDKVTKIHGYSRHTLPCNTGTRIEFCLKDLFNNHLRNHSSSQRTKFIFVTDAEDRISDASGCISAKNNCQRSYNNTLDCFCLLTGSGGSCSNELKRIFGSNSFTHCTNGNFKNVLNTVVGNNKKANNLAKTSENLADDIQVLKGNNDKEIKTFGEDIEKVQNLVKESQTKTENARRKIGETRANLQTLESQKTSVNTQCNNARTHSEIDAAEDAAKALKRKYRGEDRRLNEAGKELDAASTSLQNQSAKAEEMATKLKQKGGELSTKATKIIGDLVEGIKTLAGIQAGAYEQVKLLRGKFRQQLDDLMSVVKDSNNLAEEFEQCQDNIDGAFKSLQRGRSDWNDFKREITNHIGDVNRLLERLDER